MNRLRLLQPERFLSGSVQVLNTTVALMLVAAAAVVSAPTVGVAAGLTWLEGQVIEERIVASSDDERRSLLPVLGSALFQYAGQRSFPKHGHLFWVWDQSSGLAWWSFSFLEPTRLDSRLWDVREKMRFFVGPSEIVGVQGSRVLPSLWLLRSTHRAASSQEASRLAQSWFERTLPKLEEDPFWPLMREVSVGASVQESFFVDGVSPAVAISLLPEEVWRQPGGDVEIIVRGVGEQRAVVTLDSVFQLRSAEILEGLQ